MRRFVKIESEIKKMGRNKEDFCVIGPVFNIAGKDIMRKGGQFYAVLDPETGMWSTNQQDLYRIIDDEIYRYVDKHCKEDGFGVTRDTNGHEVILKLVDDSKSRMLIEFNKWFNNLPPNHNYIPLDSDLTFLSDKVDATMYRSKRLPYDLVDGDTSAYDRVMSVLYDEQNREKIEWAIGSVLSGDSKKIEKMIVIYGKGGTGKSTVLDLIQEIFHGYCGFFIAEELALKSNQFATAAFKDNPLIAIQDDGSLAKIDSPRINEVVSHKVTYINEKNTKQYTLKPKAMLFMATNDEVTLYNTNLGITRRLLDVYPTYQLLPVGEYRQLVAQMTNFEVPAIAKHCLDVYQKLGKEYYSKYRPEKMIQKTNYIHNFVYDEFEKMKHDDPVSRNTLFKSFKQYCDDMNLHIKMTGIQFGEQIQEYYETCYEYKWLNGRTERNVLSGFKAEMFMDPYQTVSKETIAAEEKGWLKFDSDVSEFDEWCLQKDFQAQYDTGKIKPIIPWLKINTTMEDIDSHKLHWVNIPVEERHIRIDFDIRNEDGEKDLAKNIEAANKFPPTYAEISKSGGGVHLHYFYAGDPLTLSQYYLEDSKDIEIKNDKGGSGCRRKLTKCNTLPMATLPVGSLPLAKEREKMVSSKEIESVGKLKALLAKHMRKEIVGSTAQSVSLMKSILDDAYASGMTYDVSDMEDDIAQFAWHSSNSKDRCLALVDEMHFKSKDIEQAEEKNSTPTGGETNEDKPIAFFDVEVFPNVFILCWKYAGEKASVTKLINPNKDEVKRLFNSLRLIGFNNRDYDNHICWYYMQSGSPYICYDISQRIINKKDQSAKAWQAYGLSYTDVYDFASNPNKMSLKKWEIKLGIHHQENSYPWDEDLPEDKWDEVADYCANDVIATEKVFDHIQGDYMARLILAKLSGLTPNDKTNKHSMQIIFGDDQNPQREFVYTDLRTIFPGYVFDPMAPKKKSKSTYKGYEVGEGGFVWSKPGMYRHVVTFDVASMHPSSLIALNLFGDKYTKRFKEIKDARLAIKHEDRNSLANLLDAQLLEFYDEALEENSEYTIKDLATAIKTVINSVYGLTAASFDNRCRDPKNVDNIVAKRGALFMVDLLTKVTKEWGGEVIHIKTDSIKVVNPSDDLSEKIIAFGKQYGYEFEVESKYDRICLVDKAQYIAKEEDGHWEPKGDMFLNPVVFKTLFSGEDITLEDLGVTIAADKGALYLDFNEDLPEGEHDYRFVGKVSSFIPIKPGNGGAELKVLRDEKYSYPGGCTGWRWFETEFFRLCCVNSVMNNEYYTKLIDDTKEVMREFGDPDRFINDPDYDPQLERILSVPEDVDDEVPFDEDKQIMNKPE